MKLQVDLPETPRGGPDNISKKEDEDLTKKLKTVERHAAKKDRSWWHNALLKLSWWHVVLVIVINDIMLIAVGSLVGSAFYSIEPIKDGSFRADRIEVEGLAIDPDNGAVLVELEALLQ